LTNICIDKTGLIHRRTRGSP